jgi:hypothetical protein
MNIRPLWNQSLHLPGVTVKYSATSPSRVVIVLKHNCWDWKVSKECDAMPWDKSPKTINNTGKASRSLKSRKCDEFNAFMRKIIFLISTKCKRSYLWVFPRLENFQSYDNVCWLFCQIVTKLVHHPRITNHDHKYSLEQWFPSTITSIAQLLSTCSL